MIRKLLVANRGEIARRIFRTCREIGVETVAVFSDPDEGEPHANEADQAVNLPGSSPLDTYLNAKVILSAASMSGADAIHPGYGFLAENPEFATAVTEAGLIWIGPTPHAVEVMGSKIASKKLMESAGVPTLPGVNEVDIQDEAVAELGYPVVVKASAGGGGKGMRVVTSANDLEEAVAGAKREAASAFGDATVFIEKYLPAPRHVEIQVFGDTHDNVIALFERECSIQRRHQKIIEETPSVAVDEDLRNAMSEAAITAARAVDYVGAGTVEFLLQGREFFFLEMNTRLQVEHPVTEAVSGLDLVKLQIDVANGETLPPEAIQSEMTGHAIEARLYAEDPLNNFLPVTGLFHRFTFESVGGIRVDSGIESGSEVSVHYDPMLAKVIAHAPSREEARALLAETLRAARIHGSTTNRDMLVRILESEQFVRGETDTHFIGRHDLDQLAAPLATEDDEALASRAAAISDQANERSHAKVQGTIPSGFRNSQAQSQHRAYRGAHSEHQVSYALTTNHVVFDGEERADIISSTPDRVELSTGDRVYEFDVARYGSVRHVDSQSTPTRLVEISRFPEVEADEDAGSLHAPMPGKIIRVDIQIDDVVSEGQILVVLEAMKMEHTVRAPHAGTVVRVGCREGDQVEADAVLVVVESEAATQPVDG